MKVHLKYKDENGKTHYATKELHCSCNGGDWMKDFNANHTAVIPQGVAHELRVCDKCEMFRWVNWRRARLYACIYDRPEELSK